MLGCNLFVAAIMVLRVEELIAWTCSTSSPSQPSWSARAALSTAANSPGLYSYGTGTYCITGDYVLYRVHTTTVLYGKRTPGKETPERSDPQPQLTRTVSP